jgi:hypothetical protein
VADGSGGGSSWFGSISTKLLGIKTKKRPISSIINFYKVDYFSFCILFRNPEKPNETDKLIRYRVKNPDDCANIMAKLRFLTI